MGNTNYKIPKTDADNSNCDHQTPNGKAFKLLDEDPRSPAGSGIQRTPIQVEKTPEDDSSNDENYPSEEIADRKKQFFKPKAEDSTPRLAPRSPLKTLFGSSAGSPFSYLRHKQVQRMTSKREQKE